MGAKILRWQPVPAQHDIILQGGFVMPSYENALHVTPQVIDRVVNDKQWLVKTETEDFLRALSEHSTHSRQKLWNRDYSSRQAYLQSVEPNRARWLAAVGDLSTLDLPEPEGEVVWEPFMEDDELVARWLIVPVAGSLRAHGVVALPKKRSGQLPLVIAQHGIGSSPETVFGLTGSGGAYQQYGRELVRRGFAVLAPKNVMGAPPRSRLERICKMLGITLWGVEIHKIRCLLDTVLAMPEIDAERVGMWGISLGGAYTLFTVPLEPRIKAAVCCAWFNDRVKKMVFDDPRYSCFLSVQEEYVFIPRWLAEFHDEDLASLICPRPLQIQTGKADGIAWWPFVVETCERAREHYARLGIPEAIELDLHEGGHEIRTTTGLDFLERWLTK
jgi:hypothetical protein